MFSGKKKIEIIIFPQVVYLAKKKKNRKEAFSITQMKRDSNITQQDNDGGI